LRERPSFAQSRFLILKIGKAMNRPVLEGLRLNTPAYVQHPRLM